MKNQEIISMAFERIVQAMTKQPAIAKGTISTKVTYRDGLACDIESGPWKLSADMPAKTGGTESAPAPGIYMSAALGSCQVITIALWAARYGVPIDKLEIEVQIERDSRGLYGIDQSPPRWKGIGYSVTIQSPADESEVQRVLDAAYEHSPMRDNLEHNFSIRRNAHITSTVS